MGKWNTLGSLLFACPVCSHWCTVIRLMSFIFSLGRNASLGLCQCEKDEWKTAQKGLWNFVMSPYEDQYVDVKFIGEISGSITVSVEEGELFSPHESVWSSLFYYFIFDYCHGLSIFTLCRFSKMASVFSCIGICFTTASTSCQQLGSLLLQQFNGYWDFACGHNPSFSGIWARL